MTRATLTRPTDPTTVALDAGTVSVARHDLGFAYDDSLQGGGIKRRAEADQANQAICKSGTTAGVGLLLMSVLSALGYLVAVKGLVVPGNAAGTAKKVADHEGLFRFGILSLYLVAVLDVVVAWALYRVFKPVSVVLSKLAALLRVAYAVMFVVAISELVGVFSAHAQALRHINSFTDIWDAALVVFGLNLFVLACLAYSSGYVPRLLGVLLGIAGFGYVFDTVVRALVRGSSSDVSAITGMGEFVFALWLVIRGRRITVSDSESNDDSIWSSPMTAKNEATKTPTLSDAIEPMPWPAAAETMKAIVQTEYGTAPEAVLRVEDIARPTIGDDEVLVRVRAVSVDRGTWHLMTGLPKLMRIMGFGLRRPKQPNPGRSLAGVVEAVGQNVTEFEPGDEVYGTCGGSFVEYARARVGLLARKPKNLSFEMAAAVPVSGVTVLQGVRDRAQVQAGQRVLVIGASGGVGTFAVQIAKAFGAEVTAVCSTSKIDLVRSLGADHVIDYPRDDFAEGDPRYDVIIDIGGNSRLLRLRRALAPGGRLVIVGGETGGRWLGGFDRQLRALALSPLVSQKLSILGAKENSADLSVLRELLEAERVRPYVDRSYPLSETAAAIRYLQEGHARGKVVIAV